MPYPLVRRAESRDYESIWSIWMQDHISQWMSFIKQDKEAFKKRYDELNAASHIYVLIDLVDGAEKVVGVRRIHYGKEGSPYQHIAEYCSMGIHKDFQGRGYAQFFYKEFEKIVRDKGIKKLELTQSGGNEAAFHIADKLSFTQEGLFPDWLPRTHHDGSYHLIERYVHRFLDDNLAQLASSLPSLKYQDVFPELKTQTSVKIERENNTFTCYIDNKPLFTLCHEPNETTYRHIGFLSFESPPKEYSPEAVAGLKMILQKIMQEARVKKIEFFTSDPIVIQICQHAGFFVRGEKIASYCENGIYQNELGLEYSFFGIDDAKKLSFSQTDNPHRKANVEKALNQCQETIKALESEGLCDNLGSHYLENLIYQMIRDELGPNKVFSLTEKNWQPLLSYVPHALWVDISDLYKQLHTHSFNFFTQPTLPFVRNHQVPAVEAKQNHRK